MLFPAANDWRVKIQSDNNFDRNVGQFNQTGAPSDELQFCFLFHKIYYLYYQTIVGLRKCLSPDPSVVHIVYTQE